MRRITFLCLLAIIAGLPMMNALAVPAPDPSAILDIGPPPKGETAEQYCKRLIGAQTCHPTLCTWWSDPEVRKLPSVARFKDARPWLAKNLRVTEEKGERRLRFTFQAGTRAEQVAILNALLRENLAVAEDAIKRGDEWIRLHEKLIRENQERIKTIRDPQKVAELQTGIDNLRTDVIPRGRAEITRWKQVAVIKWAK
jgi:hypothetical protein